MDLTYPLVSIFHGRELMPFLKFLIQIHVINDLADTIQTSEKYGRGFLGYAKIY